MKGFLDDNFILDTETAEHLYHEYAKQMPIYDYHCHLPPREIAENKKFDSIAEVWLGGDHYKWRAMRTNGISEEYITGSADPWEKFLAWARTVSKTIGNPLYQWTHLELRRYFGIDELLNEDTARDIYARCNEMLASDDFRTRRLMERMNVRLACTTDDPVDDLAEHKAISEDTTFGIPIYPAFRSDKVFKIHEVDFWNEWIGKLSERSGVDVGTFPSLLEALESRSDYFHERRCRLSDHGIIAPFPLEGTAAEAAAVFDRARSGSAPTEDQRRLFGGVVMAALGRMYAKRGWVMQLHLLALRNNNTKMFKRLGPDTGFDSMADEQVAPNLVALLDDLASDDALPKTILYTLNPRENELLASIAGSFMDGETPGKVQVGSGWWFNDQRDGMERQMTALANIGLLSMFVGMITDSRSFLSYPRHEYFRRVLCRLIGRWASDGEIPAEREMLGGIVQDVCYNNAVAYFGLEL